jgi:hypothetical protein
VTEASCQAAEAATACREAASLDCRPPVVLALAAAGERALESRRGAAAHDGEAGPLQEIFSKEDSNAGARLAAAPHPKRKTNPRRVPAEAGGPQTNLG